MPPTEVDIRRCHVLQRLVMSLIIVVGNEVLERELELTREVLVFEFQHVLHCPTLDARTSR